MFEPAAACFAELYSSTAGPCGTVVNDNFVQTAMCWRWIQGNRIHVEGAIHIAKHLPLSKLTILDLSNNPLSDAGIQALSRVRSMPCMRGNCGLPAALDVLLPLLPLLQVLPLSTLISLGLARTQASMCRCSLPLRAFLNLDGRAFGRREGGGWAGGQDRHDGWVGGSR